MKRTVVPFVVAVVLTGAAAANAQNTVKAEQGAALFASQKCTMCHSAAGKGNPKGPLDNVVSTYKVDEIRQWLLDPDAMRAKTQATRTPAMKPIKLSGDQIDALVAYLTSLKPVKATDDAGR
jgi:mono/diheme cytochrome c family protein